MSQPTKPAKAAPKPAATESDWTKLWPSAAPRKSEPLLKALHILTRDSALNADSRRKLTQVLHLTQLLKPAIETMLKESDDPILADLGAGKSYLGFILYDLLIGPAGKGRVIGVETREKLVETSRQLATQSGFGRLDFITAPIAEANLPGGKADMVTALHACDTATDDAIRFALRHEAKWVALVPCCQAEVARLLDGHPGPMRQLWRHPIQRREFGAHLTNVIRGLVLEAHGYKVRVTEFTGLEHTMKNELILAERHQLSNAQARGELNRLIDQIGVKPALLDVMAA
ncbi:class I SAM-dependent methyltransferase [Undibacter mobilis]|uniref:SAM-dependent methyltransferase n=1 Tax=Undibacter mobilis TaxID=2292256 RepID=A0A371B149_9BRAD|nr:SAM-dependent methyltransferase [Undibacter mobilis]RDV01305.1 SAM-dependent methyltransferase [Undibacter mobilis]